MTSLTAQDPTYYDVQKYGPPIKDLGSLGTIHTFSSTVLWQGLPRQGIRLSEQDAEDYVAYYMGFAPSDTGRMLARNIVTGLEKTAPAYASKQYMDAMTRLLNGD
ncbi:tat pathway signal sequence [Metarhizium guizhouense ARSEF 977]|uniref:Tat pathway signal sequence n=1 Tax=Metarhizium guizhouense (strain ARSEF 977) TaxID=1276136 RepID=A0A0B4GWM9_METGA|nr:tat pathway signal sequence [Metarhizium guizhouense ARSEF 977]